MTENWFPTRRGLIVAGSATAAGAAAFTLAACAPTSQGQPSETQATGLQPGTELAPLADIPVGGSLGVQVEGSAVLLSQPTEGEAVAFSAICRHQGCVVAAAGETFDCPCHGSRYDAATGDVLNGPSTLPLIPIAVTVTDGRVLVA